MANTKKTKTTEEEVAVEKTATKTAKADTEKEALKAQLEAQSKQIELLMAQMQAMMAGSAAAQPVEKKSDKMIRFINLVPGVLVLRGSGTRIWRIDGQFNHRDFTEHEALEVIGNMTGLINDGAVYITDDEFIKEHNLEDTFNNVLSDVVLKSILEQDATSVVALYEQASDLQKNILVEMITRKVEGGEDVDANILKRLSKYCGKDLLALEPEDGE